MHNRDPRPQESDQNMKEQYAPKSGTIHPGEKKMCWLRATVLEDLVDPEWEQNTVLLPHPENTLISAY